MPCSKHHCYALHATLNTDQILVFGLSALAVEAYGFTLVRASVCASHHIWRSAHQILMIFCTKLHLDESKKMFLADFWKKFSFAPQGGFWPKNGPFWLKNGLLSLYLQNRASYFDDFFSQMLDIIALNNLALVLCTKKILVPLFAP